MKIFFNKYIFLLLSVLVFASCDKKDNDTTDAPTMAEFLASKPELSLFAKAVNKAGLQSFLNGPGPFTWFAPNNDAFTASGITEDSLNKLTPGQVNYILLYHLANASLSSTNMVAINSTSRTTQLGGANTIYFGTFNGETYINGSKISSRDNRVSNGYVHTLNRLLVPPVLKGNIQSILSGTGKHTLFIQALTKAGLWASFGTTAVFTVFAPTDAAMTAAGYTSTSIAAVPASGTAFTSFVSAMRYHYILNLRLFTNDLMKTSLPATSAGSSFFITPSEMGTKIKGKSNATAATIIQSDILGTNGVVHVIDAVLKP